MLGAKKDLKLSFFPLHFPPPKEWKPQSMGLNKTVRSDVEYYCFQGNVIILARKIFQKRNSVQISRVCLITNSFLIISFIVLVTGIHSKYE